MFHLFAENRRNIEGHPGRRTFLDKFIQDIKKWNIALRNCLAEPIGAMGPSTVMKHPRQVRMQGQNNVSIMHKNLLKREMTNEELQITLFVWRMW
jgi:hypothetical protein